MAIHHAADRVQEWANAGTHALGAILAVVGLVVLMDLAFTHGDLGDAIALGIYGVTLVVLYSASTLYHGCTHGPLKEAFHRLDHAAIYLLIAGTFTPFTLLILKGGLGIVVCIAVWAVALAGVAFKLWGDPDAHPRRSAAFYLALSWVGMAVTGPDIVTGMDTEALLLLLAGGVAYTGGVPFYLWKSRRFTHAVWHLFVLAGSTFHFAAIAAYALPSA